MTERTLHPLEYLAILKRRKRWFLIPLALCLVIGVVTAYVWPTTFVSRATVAVQAPAVAPDLVSPAMLDHSERLRALSQQLRSASVLERVAREEGLVTEGNIELVAQRLMRGISVEPVKSIAQTDRGPELNAFYIVYRDSTPERTRSVADRLAQVFVEEHSRSRERQAEGTAEFLARQLRDSQDRLATLESRLRTAKEQYNGRLPEQAMANLETLGGMRQQLSASSNSLRSEQDRLSMIERQIQSMRQGIFSAPAGSSPMAVSPQQRISTLQNQLAEARAKYTPQHPEIAYLEGELKTARAQAADIKSQPASSREELLAGDPMYQQLVAERNLTQLRIRSLQRAENLLQADIAKYQQRVEATPMVEQELVSLQRDYDFERDNYKQLAARHSASLVQEQIARTRGGERFSVLQRAALPDSPESPHRARIILIALALGLGLGGGLTFGREYLDWSVRDARTLQDEFDVPVLAEIPRIREVA